MMEHVFNNTNFTHFIGRFEPKSLQNKVEEVLNKLGNSINNRNNNAVNNDFVATKQPKNNAERTTGCAQQVLISPQLGHTVKKTIGRPKTSPPTEYVSASDMKKMVDEYYQKQCNRYAAHISEQGIPVYESDFPIPKDLVHGDFYLQKPKEPDDKNMLTLVVLQDIEKGDLFHVQIPTSYCHEMLNIEGFDNLKEVLKSSNPNLYLGKKYDSKTHKEENNDVNLKPENKTSDYESIGDVQSIIQCERYAEQISKQGISVYEQGKDSSDAKEPYFVKPAKPTEEHMLTQITGNERRELSNEQVRAMIRLSGKKRKRSGVDPNRRTGFKLSPKPDISILFTKKN